MMRRRFYLILFFLSLATLLVYGRVLSHDFINYDDPQYVTDNAHVRTGLNWQNVNWAFSSRYASNWHPLTWWSHMLDCQIYGSNPGGHHLTSLLFHIFNTLLLFFLFRRTTKSDYQSAFVAFLFALHPLHIESVAWISERKDVLSTIFWMLTTWAYVLYVERKTFTRYLLVFSGMALGLMAKPMLVALPFTLLLLDYWPLKRDVITSLERPREMRFSAYLKLLPDLVFEKIPLFTLSIISSIVTYRVQKEAISSLEIWPFITRVMVTFVTYIHYIGKTIWPHPLVIPYPYPGHDLPSWKVVSAILILTAVTIFVVRKMERHRYLATGWFWYLGTLIPVIGLVKVGSTNISDRYMYIPSVGLFLIASWGGYELLVRWKLSKKFVWILAVFFVLVFSTFSWIQLGYWQNSSKLFEHTFSVMPNNHLAHKLVADAFEKLGKDEEAIKHYLEALRLRPDSVDAKNNLGILLAKLGRLNESMKYYSEALGLESKDPDVLTNIGTALAKQGKLEEAIKYYSQALSIKPDFAEAHNNLGSLLDQLGRYQEAIPHYTEALRLRPDFAEAHSNLGGVFGSLGKYDQAIYHFSEALRLKPDFDAARRNLELAMKKRSELEQSKS